MDDTVTDIRYGFKAVTHDNRPPVRGGDPLWPVDAPLPVTLGPVELDTSGEECGAGLNYCATIDDALRIAGFWPDGWPSALYVVEADESAIARGDKRRAASVVVVARVPEADINAAIERLTAGRFGMGDEAEAMAREQIQWREALARPDWTPADVEAGLARAIEARGLGWEVRRYDSAWAAWDAWAARAAWDAQYTARRHWITAAPDRHTVGIRDAYRAGLAVALPTGPGELGWAMVGAGAMGEVGK